MSIKKYLRDIAEKIFQSNWYPNKKIIFESVPDMSCHAYPVFLYMINQGFNEKYKIVWFVSDKNDFKDVKIKNVFFQNIKPTGKFESFKRLYTILTSRAILYTNRYISKAFKKQIQIYLKHGTCIKSRLKHCREDDLNESDICITISEFFNKYDVEEIHIDESHLTATGYPRNDYLFEKHDYCKDLYTNEEFKKVIIWMPTFRQNDNGARIDSTFDFPLGIPCIYSEEDCIKLNDVLKSRDALLVLKPHPAQDLSVLKAIDLTNFKVLYDVDLKKAGIQLYQFLASTDALITDYSSVYYDYLLTGKPIGITIDDIDIYASETGFVFDNVLDILAGEHIKDADEFMRFIEDVADGIDNHSEERERICNMVHNHRDAKSSERIYNLLIEELDKRYK